MPNKTVAVVIPARYASTRLPGKPLLKKTGKYLMQHVYENVLKCASPAHVLIATDDRRIFDAAKSFGARVEMTSAGHRSGTDRMAEVAERTDAGIFVNVQGDEPEMDPGHIDRAVEALLKDSDSDVSTVCSPISGMSDLEDRNTVKCVVDSSCRALYFSRSPVPCARSGDYGEHAGSLLRHHGIYCFRREALLEFPKLGSPPMECLEELEQLRLLWHGYVIKVVPVDSVPKGIDTEPDYEAFVARMSGRK